MVSMLLLLLLLLPVLPLQLPLCSPAASSWPRPLGTVTSQTLDVFFVLFSDVAVIQTRTN
jgi:hypothetical protein